MQRPFWTNKTSRTGRLKPVLLSSIHRDARGVLRIAEECDMDNRRYVFEW
nr:MAG TPA: hypothetical protein [Caudoviricetes sp.]